MENIAKNKELGKLNALSPLEFRVDETEADIIGTILCRQDLILEVLKHTNSCDFAGPGHCDLLNMMTEIFEKDGAIDGGILSNKLENDKTLKKKLNGIIAFEAMKEGAVYTVPVLREKCKIVKLAAKKRILAREIKRAESGLINGFSPTSITEKLFKEITPVSRDTVEHEIKTPDWPKLSEKALPGTVGAFVRLATDHSEADPAAVLTTFLTRFGVEVGAGPRMWVGDTAHGCRLASVIVGASSKARKGTSGKPVKRLFSTAVSNNSTDYMPAHATAGPFSTGEGIIYLIRDEVKKFDEKSGEWIVTDAGVDDKRLFIFDEEFGGAMSCAKREGSTLSMIIRKMWDGGTLAPIIKNNRTIATGGHVGWVSHITLFELNTRLNESEAFNGFANRILWVCAKRQQLVAWPEPMDKNRLHTIQAELFSIIAAAQDEKVIRPDAATREAWADHYPHLTRSKPGLLGSVTNRAEAQTLRLAMIYCLLDGKTIIELPHLEAALAFWDYCEQSAKLIFHGKSQDIVARKILDSLQDGPKTGTEIHRLFASHVTKGRLEIGLSELCASDRVSKTLKKTAGRPVTLYKIKQSLSVKSVISVKSPNLHPDQGLNTLNTLNTQGKSKKDGLVQEGEI